MVLLNLPASCAKKKHNDSIDSASLTNEEGSKEISCARRRFAPCICD
jgi:hypothetical protein